MYEEESRQLEEEMFQKQIEETQLERRSQLQDVCKSLPAVSELSKGMFGHSLVDDNRKFVYCKIFKVASSSMKKFLINSTTERYMGHKDLKINNNHFLHKMGLNDFSKFSYEGILYRLVNYFKFIIVRHPLRRLYSAYKDKFLGTHPDNVKRFQKGIGRHIMKKYRKNATKAERDTGRNVTFTEFLQYVIETEKNPDGHWRPFFNNCMPCVGNYDFIAKLETFDTDFKYILSRIPHTDVPLPKNRPSNTAVSVNDDEDSFKKVILQVRRDIMKKILDIFRLDFLIFSYDITLAGIVGKENAFS